MRCPIRSADDWDPPQVTPDAPLPGEQVVLDGNVEAQGHSFFSLGGLSISGDGRWLAFSTDVVGNERYTVRFRNLDTGEERPETISDTTGGGDLVA